MNKSIVIKMMPDKEIVIFRDGQEFLKIAKDKRSIGAEDLFNLFDYNVGDTYEIVKENENNVDAPVIDFFYELISDIKKRISDFKEEEETLFDIGTENSDGAMQ